MKKLLLVVFILLFFNNGVMAKSLSEIDDKNFCLKTTFIDFKNGNTFWKDSIKLDIKLDIKYSANEIIEEANKRKLNLLDCFYISDGFRLLNKKLRILNKNSQKFEVVEDNIIKNLKEKFKKKEWDYKYKVPSGYIAKLNLDKKNNSNRYFGSYLREDGKEIFLGADVLKGKISGIHITLKNFEDTDYLNSSFGTPENKKWKINKDNKFEVKTSKLISTNRLRNPGPVGFTLGLDGILKNDIILISRLNLTGHEEFKELKDFYNEFAISLGCGIERDDVDDCIRRWLPSIISTGPMTLEQVNEIKNDEELMGEIVLAIKEMNRKQGQSQQEPSQEEQEQARSEQGYYAKQSQGNYVWVDTRSGYQKFTDKWCRCSPGQAYMLNRAAKNYFSGAPMSGFEKFILRGTNINKVIKMYK